MVVSRRTFLHLSAATTATAVAGCLTRPDRSDGFQPVEADPIPPDDDTGIDVEVTVENGFTDDFPARIELAFTNTADETRGFTGANNSPPFGSEDDVIASREGGDARLVAVPESLKDSDDRGGPEVTVVDPDNPRVEKAFPYSPDDECWQLPGELDGIESVVHPVQAFSVEPDETVSEVYELYSHHADECLVPGTYPFETTLANHDVIVEYGFTVTLVS